MIQLVCNGCGLRLAEYSTRAEMFRLIGYEPHMRRARHEAGCACSALERRQQGVSASGPGLVLRMNEAADG
jgi:hypothetical protein